MVISWAPGQQDTVELLLEPPKGMTRELLHYAGEGALQIFSSCLVDLMEEVLPWTSTRRPSWWRFGIAAHLPYLKRLIYSYKAHLIRARRIYLVWQIRDRGEFGLP
jgi:hypothetical protein